MYIECSHLFKNPVWYLRVFPRLESPVLQKGIQAPIKEISFTVSSVRPAAGRLNL